MGEHAIRTIQANYKRAVANVHHHAKQLRSEILDAERHPDEAHTPGNIGRTAACLDAAREKAYALRETLEVLGAMPETTDG